MTRAKKDDVEVKDEMPLDNEIPGVVDNRPELDTNGEVKMDTDMPNIPKKDGTTLSFHGYTVVKYEELMVQGRMMIKAQVVDQNGGFQEMTVLPQEFKDKAIVKKADKND